MKIYSFFILFFILLSSFVNSLFGAPTITMLTPNTGSSSGGQIITIIGTGFTGATSVSFDGISTAFVVQSDTSIAAFTPAHTPQVVPVIVTTPSGSSAATSASSYVYQSDPLVYVSSLTDGTVSVINTTSNTVIATPLVGILPISIAITPNGAKIYVVNQLGTDVSVIDRLTNTVITTIPVGINPSTVVIAPDGTRAYVTNSNSNDVSVIDTTSEAVIATIPVGNTPLMIAFTLDGTKAYVSNFGSASVSVIDTASNTVIATIPVGSFPAAVATTPDGTRLYVANFNSASISVIDTASNTVIATVPVGLNPIVIALNPDGTKAYSTNTGDASVSVIDTASNTVIATIPVGIGPQGMAIAPDGTRAYVTNQIDGTVSVIDTVSNTVITTIPVGFIPNGIITTPDGTKVYVTNQADGTVSVIDTASNTVVATIPAGNPAVSPIAITPDQAPLANFMTSTSSFLAGLPIVFDASSSASPFGVIANYFWDFGDGTSLNTTLPIVDHTYAAPGVYSVSLTVTNSAGTSTQQIFSFISNVNSKQGSPTLKNNGGPTALTIQFISISPGLPVITNVDPNFGPISGGTSVTITGLNFTGATAVLFGSTPAVSFIVNSDTSITAVSPPGVGTVDIRVVTPSGISAITPVDQFTYLAPLPPRDLKGRQVKNKFATQTDIVNILTWKAPIDGATPVAYKIYRNAQLTKLATVIPANDKLRFEDHNRQPGKTYRYFVVTVDEAGNESVPVTFLVKGQD